MAKPRKPAPADPPAQDVDLAPLSGDEKTIGNKERFLEAFSKLGNVTAAARSQRLGRTQLYHWRNVDPEFKRRWDEEALPAAIDTLEAVAWKMATQGDSRVRRQYDRAGQLVSEEHEVVRYPGVLIHLLKVWDPDRHSERIVAEHRGKDGGPVALDIQAVLKLAQDYKADPAA